MGLALRVLGTVKRAALVLGILSAAYLTLVLFPQPLFAYHAQRENVVLHARQPFPPQTAVLLEEIVRRVSLSPFYDRDRTHHVFLCDTTGLFTFFEPLQSRVGGVAQIHLTGNVFIRPYSIERGTLTGPSGKEKTGERNLTYFVAHEITHAMTAARIGRWRYLNMPAFQVEGYADYVGMGHRVDLAAGRAALLADGPDMHPRLSGSYSRYALLVAYLLDEGKLTPAALFARPLDQAAIERQLTGTDRSGGSTSH